MTDDLTPVRAREMLCDAQYEPQPECAWQMADNAGRAILAAWERDRADRDALRERLAEVARVLHRVAECGAPCGMCRQELVSALAAIRAEREGARD
jgi:bacterioferritin-associated ferredoxin